MRGKGGLHNLGFTWLYLPLLAFVYGAWNREHCETPNNMKLIPLPSTRVELFFHVASPELLID